MCNFYPRQRRACHIEGKHSAKIRSGLGKKLIFKLYLYFYKCNKKYRTGHFLHDRYIQFEFRNFYVSNNRTASLYMTNILSDWKAVKYLSCSNRHYNQNLDMRINIWIFPSMKINIDKTAEICSRINFKLYLNSTNFNIQENKKEKRRKNPFVNRC